MRRFVILLGAVLLVGACTGREKGVREIAMDIPGFVAMWDFGGENPLSALGNRGLTLEPVQGIEPPTLEQEGPLSGQSLHFEGGEYLRIPFEQTGALNIQSGQVSVVAWIKWQKGQTGFVGGMWDESTQGGKRQYGLFVSLPHYNGQDAVCGHISKTGKPTPPFPHSIDYSASRQSVPDGQWCTVGFTYDGKHIRSYLNGVFEERAPELINHTTGFDGYPDGLVQCKNPYFFPDGLGCNGSDFTLGAVLVGGRPGNFFQGNIGGIAVYSRALSDAEMLSLNQEVFEEDGMYSGTTMTRSI